MDKSQFHQKLLQLIAEARSNIDLTDIRIALEYMTDLMINEESIRMYERELLARKS